MGALSWFFICSIRFNKSEHSLDGSRPMRAKPEYISTRGISANYFPYLNQEGYLSPAIFVEFTKPKRKFLTKFLLTFVLMVACIVYTIYPTISD